MKLLSARKNGYISDVKRLYESAFPETERKPFDFILKLEDDGKAEILAAEEDGEFAGLAINLLCDNKTALLDYFAIDADKRSGGMGGKALLLLLERFKNRKLIFEIEREDDNAENADERKRRKKFYLKNGVKETGVFANVYSTDFELLTNDGILEYDEYVKALINSVGSEVVNKLNPVRL